MLKRKEMRKLIVTILAVIAIICASFAGHNNTISYDQLPIDAQEFISHHFNGVEIDKATHCSSPESGYQVLFDNGTMVTFNSEGKWLTIHCATGSHIPMTSLPAQLRDFMAQHHPEQSVVGMEHNAEGYLVYLSNNTTLQFDKFMHFVKEG